MSYDKKKLLEDLKAAQDAAFKLAMDNPDDGGTCNFDACALKVPGRPKDQDVLEIIKAAGLDAFKTKSGLYRGFWLLQPPVGAQANRRSRQAELMAKILRERGWATGVYYQMD